MQTTSRLVQIVINEYHTVLDGSGKFYAVLQ